MKNCYASLVILHYLISLTQGFSVPDVTLSLVASTTKASIRTRATYQTSSVRKVPEIYHMSIKSNINNRFAHTTIVSKVRNYAAEAREATFFVILPEDAFISGFIMEVDGKNYTAYVKEKEEARKEYEMAVSRGMEAAHVAVSARNSFKFIVSVNVEPKTAAAFYLTYEQLLKREKGRYEHVININPGQLIEDFGVEVLITENRNITELRVPSLRSGNEIEIENEELDPLEDIEVLSKSSRRVKFSPNEERQQQLANVLKTNTNDGLSGQFVVQYDVERDPKGGNILVHDDHFVHFFAPKELEPLPQHVVFVLDTSGSMRRSKIKQLKQAMTKILDELHEKDLFNLVEFNSIVRVWNLDNASESVTFQGEGFYESSSKNPFELNDISFPPAYPATTDFITKAKNSIKKFDVTGGTDILASIAVGLQLIENEKKKRIDSIDRQPVVIVLTDGEFSESFEVIMRTVAELNSGLRKSRICSLSFGDKADQNNLQTVALRNMGVFKHIYEASDAALQLQDFYNQISSPLLADVNFKYGKSVSQVSNTNFPAFYDGSELVVAGSYKDKNDLDLPTVNGKSYKGLLTLTPDVEHTASNIERLGAYLKVKQLLEKITFTYIITDDNIEEIRKEALNLCLKYSFVTSLSSLVVVKPQKSQHGFSSVPLPPDSHNTKVGLNRRDFVPTTAPLPTDGVNIDGGLVRRGFVPSDSSSEENETPKTEVTDSSLSVLAGILNLKVGLNRRDFVPTTTEPLPTDGVNIDHSVLEGLPWLNSIMSNGYLRIAMQTFKVFKELNDTEIPNQACSAQNVPGNCTFLVDCVTTLYKLTSVDDYLQHFCILENKYAGICCTEP